MMESGKIRVAGFIVKECCKEPSNWRASMTLPDYLKSQGVMGIEGIDTRALTRHLRLNGAMRGYLSTDVSDPRKIVDAARGLPTMEGLALADKVTCEAPFVWTGRGIKPAGLADGRYDWPGNGPRLVVFDTGLKWNIMRLLTSQGFDLLMVPYATTVDQVRRLAPDAIFLSPVPVTRPPCPDWWRQPPSLWTTIPWPASVWGISFWVWLWAGEIGRAHV